MQQYKKKQLPAILACRLRYVNRNSYDEMKQLCEQFNKAAKRIRLLRQPRGQQKEELLRKIINRAYDRAVEDETKLNHCKAWSSEVLLCFVKCSLAVVVYSYKWKKMPHGI